MHGTEETNKFKHAVSEAEYEILVNLVNSEFNTPVKNVHDLKNMQLSNS